MVRRFHEPAITPMIDQDDATVMALVANGDQQAMAVIYDRYTGMVSALSRRILRDPAAADELVADIFVEIWRRASAFDASRAGLATYLMTLVRSRGIDRLRARSRQATSPLTDDHKRPAGEDDPWLRVVRDELAAVVAKALGTLNVDQRTAIELAYYQGLSHFEVANRLQRPLGTVKTHIRSGLIHLRDSLRRFSDGIR
jgi:RNA polymerase sigma-70 factor (ECF subfamily)